MKAEREKMKESKYGAKERKKQRKRGNKYSVSCLML
jgi:hypothetical protein